MRLVLSGWRWSIYSQWEYLWWRTRLPYHISLRYKVFCLPLLCMRLLWMLRLLLMIKVRGKRSIWLRMMMRMSLGLKRTWFLIKTTKLHETEKVILYSPVALSLWLTLSIIFSGVSKDSTIPPIVETCIMPLSLILLSRIDSLLRLHISGFQIRLHHRHSVLTAAPSPSLPVFFLILHLGQYILIFSGNEGLNW